MMVELLKSVHWLLSYSQKRDLNGVLHVLSNESFHAKIILFVQDNTTNLVSL